MSPEFDTDVIREPRPKRMLAPSAYSETAMPSLRLARSSRMARRIAKLLLWLMVTAFLVVAFAPWRQFIKGTGDVIAFSPNERPQVLYAPVKGRIRNLGDNIYENARVTKGQTIAVIEDIDKDYFRRLQLNKDAADSRVTAAKELWDAKQRNLEVARTVVDELNELVKAYESIRDDTIDAADAAVKSAENKVAAERKKLEGLNADKEQIKANFDRQERLFKKNITSELKFQQEERKLKGVQAKIGETEQYIESATNLVKEKESEREAKAEKARANIKDAMAKVKTQEAKVATAASEVAKAKSDWQKAKIELNKAGTDLARQVNGVVVAPFDGFLTKITPNLGTKVLKEDDPICTIVPDTADRAVQLWLDGNDSPLVEPGRHVRLQFEGWPAVQFAGWPSVAVGTFGGEVVSVDATDDGKGRFRILVRPDETQAPWPSDRFLRQGVRANGWVLLNEVPLWYEIWRNMNGFPPVVSTEEPKGKLAKPPIPKP